MDWGWLNEEECAREERYISESRVSWSGGEGREEGEGDGIRKCGEARNGKKLRKVKKIGV